MSNTYPLVFQTLFAIYDKHRRRHPKNPNSQQMCCMWSTKNPPDTLEGTRPLCDIEKAFDLFIQLQQFQTACPYLKAAADAGNAKAKTLYRKSEKCRKTL